MGLCICWAMHGARPDPNGLTLLHKLRVLGNEAAHEVKAHNSMQLELAMQIIEHMLDGTYVIPARVKSVF